MNQIKSFGVVLAMTLIVSGCQTSVVEPVSAVPSNYAAFSGVWSGTWDDVLDSTLTVQKVEPDGSVRAHYAWGNYRDIRAGSVVIGGQIEDDTLTLNRFQNGAIAQFRMREDGTLYGLYDRDGDTSGGVFTKQ